MKLLSQLRIALNKLRRIPSAERFALAPVWAQLVAIFIASAGVVFFLTPFLGDLPTSYKIFADPANYANVEGPVQLVVGLLQVLLGLVLFSFIISVLSAALVNYIESIKSGSLPFKRSGHIIFVNYNIKLPLILDQLDIKARDKAVMEEVVLLFSEPETVTNFRKQFLPERWSNLDIFIRQGDLMNFQTFERLSIFDAFSLVILLPDTVQNHFLADNHNLKILTTLINQPRFKQHLEAKTASMKPMKCSLELSNNPDCRTIAQEMSQSLFTVITPGDVIGSILARAKVDLVYYNIFFEVMAFDGSTIHFVNPTAFDTPLVGKSFEELYFKFEGGILLGYSGINANGGYQMRLCPFSEKLTDRDWLLFLTTNVKRVGFRPSAAVPALEKLDSIIPPIETVSKRICVIGDKNPLGNISDFIDVKSMKDLSEAHFVFPNTEDYFREDFLHRISSGSFENIIVNLDDEVGFRLTMWLVSRGDEGGDFLHKLVTILGDPVTENLLSNHKVKFKTVLSHKLAARYIAQISFQKNLDRLFGELAFPAGVEFNILEIDKHIPKELVKSGHELKRLLAAHQMVYLGIVDSDKNVFFEAEDFSVANQILVLSQGQIDLPADTVGNTETIGSPKSETFTNKTDI